MRGKLAIVMVLGALALALAGCDDGTVAVAPVAKPCQHADEASCNADAACGWDKNHDATKSRCKTKDKVGTMPVPAPAAPVVN